MGFWFNKLGRKPRKGADQIRNHENLTITVWARADPDRGSRDSPADRFSHWRRHEFQDDSANSRFIERYGIGQQSLALFISLAFDFVAAFFAHALGQHAQVPDEGNAF